MVPLNMVEKFDVPNILTFSLWSSFEGFWISVKIYLKFIFFLKNKLLSSKDHVQPIKLLKYRLQFCSKFLNIDDFIGFNFCYKLLQGKLRRNHNYKKCESSNENSIAQGQLNAFVNANPLQYRLVRANFRSAVDGFRSDMCTVALKIKYVSVQRLSFSHTIRTLTYTALFCMRVRGPPRENQLATLCQGCWFTTWCPLQGAHIE